LTQIKGNFAEKVIITLIVENSAKFFAENWQKLLKIVIITSVTGAQVKYRKATKIIGIHPNVLCIYLIMGAVKQGPML
jgi:hypothetical protein